MTKNQFSKVFEQGFEPAWVEFDNLQEIIKEQKQQLNLNSSNSSNPPSSDTDKSSKSKKNNSRKK